MSDNEQAVTQALAVMQDAHAEASQLRGAIRGARKIQRMLLEGLEADAAPHWPEPSRALLALHAEAAALADLEGRRQDAQARLINAKLDSLASNLKALVETMARPPESPDPYGLGYPNLNPDEE